MLGLGLGLTEVAVTISADDRFPAPPAGSVLLLDDSFTTFTSPPSFLEEDGAFIAEEI